MFAAPVLYTWAYISQPNRILQKKSYVKVYISFVKHTGNRLFITVVFVNSFNLIPNAERENMNLYKGISLFILLCLMTGCSSDRAKFGEPDVVLDGLKGRVESVRFEQVSNTKIDAQGKEHKIYNWQKIDYYDQQGKKIKHENSSFTETYKFDKAGNRMKIRYAFKQEGFLSSYFYRVEYSRNAKGQMTEMKHYQPKPLSSNRVVYEYHDEKHERIAKTYGKNNAITHKTIETYDPDGRILGKKVFVPDGDDFSLSAEYIYEYDENGVLRKQEVIEPLVSVHITETLFDEHGNRIEYKVWRVDPNDMDDQSKRTLVGDMYNTFEYQFNEQGNWIEQNEYKFVLSDTEHKKTKVETFIREIKYYE